MAPSLLRPASPCLNLAPPTADGPGRSRSAVTVSSPTRPPLFLALRLFVIRFVDSWLLWGCVRSVVRGRSAFPCVWEDLAGKPRIDPTHNFYGLLGRLIGSWNYPSYLIGFWSLFLFMNHQRSPANL
jgi:hypothetical protein